MTEYKTPWWRWLILFYATVMFACFCVLATRHMMSEWHRIHTQQPTPERTPSHGQ